MTAIVPVILSYVHLWICGGGGLIGARSVSRCRSRSVHFVIWGIRYVIFQFPWRMVLTSSFGLLLSLALWCLSVGMPPFPVPSCMPRAFSLIVDFGYQLPPHFHSQCVLTFELMHSFDHVQILAYVPWKMFWTRRSAWNWMKRDGSSTWNVFRTEATLEDWKTGRIVTSPRWNEALACAFSLRQRGSQAMGERSGTDTKRVGGFPRHAEVCPLSIHPTSQWSAQCSTMTTHLTRFSLFVIPTCIHGRCIYLFVNWDQASALTRQAQMLQHWGHWRTRQRKTTAWTASPVSRQREHQESPASWQKPKQLHRKWHRLFLTASIERPYHLQLTIHLGNCEKSEALSGELSGGRVASLWHFLIRGKSYKLSLEDREDESPVTTFPVSNLQPGFTVQTFIPLSNHRKCLVLKASNDIWEQIMGELTL